MKKGRLETMVEEGLNPRVVEGMSVLDGVNAARRTLPRVVFHERCEEQGIAALEQYQREWDDDNKVFRQNPLHNWASHLADAFRYLSLAWREAYAPPPAPKVDLKRSEEHTSELQSLMRISYAVFCLQKKNYHEHASLTQIQLRQLSTR